MSVELSSVRTPVSAPFFGRIHRHPSGSIPHSQVPQSVQVPTLLSPESDWIPNSAVSSEPFCSSPAGESDAPAATAPTPFGVAPSSAHACFDGIANIVHASVTTKKTRKNRRVDVSRDMEPPCLNHESCEYRVAFSIPSQVFYQVSAIGDISPISRRTNGQWALIHPSPSKQSCQR